ncbi:hypothetical protein E3E35_07970 [Thermococcus sp. GR7]|uniref:hypothetical protein n=1 Tax=unclassified Thermococcus TaxID=2627626 RepID=UPI0014319B4E|nr:MULTISPECIES: hypothetical protein [unclassified Thermococcus]NJE47335.1 hypothetical protein [Thermococcus sp. GR7]NJE79446.1 hypothetical protein [Thermococcus sp. GR4]NJF23175.1 hypothetical protein [Thermococcus sp. GR5]
MGRPSKGEIFVRQFVMGFGFLSGLFARLGGDPESIAMNSIFKAFEPLVPHAGGFMVLFGIMSLIEPASKFLAGYKVGGLLGIIAIFFGFLAGYAIMQGGSLWVVLLIIAATIGYFSPYVDT